MTRTMSTVISPANRGRTCREQDLQRGVFWVSFLTAMSRERSSGETDSFSAVLRIAPSLRSASCIFPALLLLLLWCLWFECMWPFILAVRQFYLTYHSLNCNSFWKTCCNDPNFKWWCSVNVCFSYISSRLYLIFIEGILSLKYACQLRYYKIDYVIVHSIPRKIYLFFPPFC